MLHSGVGIVGTLRDTSLRCVERIDELSWLLCSVARDICQLAHPSPPDRAAGVVQLILLVSRSSFSVEYPLMKRKALTNSKQQ